MQKITQHLYSCLKCKDTIIDQSTTCKMLDAMISEKKYMCKRKIINRK